jgi:hypothetical protein
VDVGTLKLDVGTLSEVVSVVAEGAAIETKNSDYSGLLTATQISQIQTRGRDVLNLLRLIPASTRKYEREGRMIRGIVGEKISRLGSMIGYIGRDGDVRLVGRIMKLKRLLI